MGSLYYVEAAEWLRAVGLTVEEPDGDGWKSRARGSGGFDAPPYGCQWHHTASSTDPINDWTWQTTGCDDAPVGNATIMRDGSIWMVAAGAANTAGKGGPLTLSRATIPQDGANSRTWAWEVANAGTGAERWPQVQVDAYFAASNAMNARFGNRPEDVFTHKAWCDPSCPGRKVDPATADAVDGPWQPRPENSYGTWSLDDIRAECLRRAGSAPGPIPPTPGGDVIPQVIKGDRSDTYWAWDGVQIAGIPDLQWLEWGYDAGLYQNTDPVVYPQDLIDVLVAAQGER